jgi:hypothetical protein
VAAVSTILLTPSSVCFGSVIDKVRAYTTHRIVALGDGRYNTGIHHFFTRLLYGDAARGELRVETPCKEVSLCLA